ncbi:MAG: cytochrome c biogenesis protein CcsA [Acidimicrobiia bacterium]|nr:cytochrome c biogenesis protein CcsA [Acidimicrobiia bacterium]
MIESVGQSERVTVVAEHTGSPFTRVLGGVALAGLALVAYLGLVATPREVIMGDAVRILYVHVPVAIGMYVAFSVTALGSVLWLWRRSVFWDVAAGASAEVGVLYTGLTLVTGMLWGRPTWGVYWVWDARLTSTALLFLMFVGYLAVRGIPAERSVRNRRAAVVGLVAFVDVPVVHYSVDWWRSLHQPATISKIDAELDGLMLFTLVVGIATFAAIYLWLVVHRFRVAWLEEQLDAHELAEAVAERRAEAQVPA